MLTKLGVAVAVLVLAGCGTSRTAGPDAPPPTDDGPTRDQVLMADGLCAAATGFDTEVAEARAYAESSADESGPGPDFYLTFVDTDLQTMITALDDLPESGVAEADRYVESFRAELDRIAPTITEVVGDSWDLAQLSRPELIAMIERVVELYESVDPDGPDLGTLVRENRDFRAFYELAPRCVPVTPPSPTAPTTSTPPPPNVAPEDAEDGTDLATCTDGDCEVAVTGSTTVTAGPVTLAVTVAGDEVTTVQEYSDGGASTVVLSNLGGAASFGQPDGTTLVVTVTGLHGDTAVLEFRTE